MLFSLFSFGQSIKHISISFDMNDFNVVQDEYGDIVISSSLHNYCLKSDTLLPALPYIGYNVLVKNEESFSSLTCSSSKIIIRKSVMMARNPEVIPTNVAPSSVGRNESFGYEQKTYPQQYVEYAGKDDCCGYRILTFLVCPFEYNAKTKTLYFRKTIDLDIHLNGSTSKTSLRVGSKNEEKLRDIIRRMIVNPEDLEDGDVALARAESNNRLVKQTGYEYVIVTSNKLRDVFQQLASWKNRKGIRSKVITTEEIYSTYEGATKQEKIKRALADIDNLSYVLLGGDTTQVPTCMCYIGRREKSDSITPADVFFSCLGTMNWDNNGNGLNGEIKDSVSIVPSISISRIPIFSIKSAQTFVNRIIEYEAEPDISDWQSSILMAGTSLGDYFYDDENDEQGTWKPVYDQTTGSSDTQIWSQMMYGIYIAPTNPEFSSWNGTLTRFYDTYTDISEDDTYDFNTENLRTELGKGYTFIDVMTHGSKLAWQMEESNYSFHSSSATLKNKGYTIITTTACNTNAFDFRNESVYCLSHDLILQPWCNILAYCGTSRENWYHPQYYKDLGVGAKFDGLTYRNLFADKYHRLGNAITAVKVDMREEALTNYTSTRKVWMGLNLLGDPEMPVFLSKPQNFHDVDVQIVNDSIYVDAGTDGFDICFINQNDSSDYYIARDIPNSVVSFERLNGEYDICITKPGYIPYFTTCNCLYLQNNTLSGTNTFKSKKAMIGSNVTNKVDHGSVVINSGKTTIKAKETTISKDFEVKKGAILVITNN